MSVLCARLVFYICIYSYMICVWSVVMDDARVFAVTEVFLVLCLYLGVQDSADSWRYDSCPSFNVSVVYQLKCSIDTDSGTRKSNNVSVALLEKVWGFPDPDRLQTQCMVRVWGMWHLCQPAWGGIDIWSWCSVSEDMSKLPRNIHLNRCLWCCTEYLWIITCVFRFCFGSYFSYSSYSQIWFERPERESEYQ